jgi:hypothetical protein
MSGSALPLACSAPLGSPGPGLIRTSLCAGSRLAISLTPASPSFRPKRLVRGPLVLNKYVAYGMPQ